MRSLNPFGPAAAADPGQRRRSEQAAQVGIAFPDLCRWLVEDASCGR